MLKIVLNKRESRSYSEDFKREVVSTYEASGKSISEICRLLDIASVSTLSRWIVLYGKCKQKNMSMKSEVKKSAQEHHCNSMHRSERSDDAAKIANLEAEIRHLREILGTNAVRERPLHNPFIFFTKMLNVKSHIEVCRIMYKVFWV